MNAELRSLLEKAENWPPEDRAALADYAGVIEARRTGHYVLDEDERTAVMEDLAQAERGEFVDAPWLDDLPGTGTK